MGRDEGVPGDVTLFLSRASIDALKDAKETRDQQGADAGAMAVCRDDRRGTRRAQGEQS